MSTFRPSLSPMSYDCQPKKTMSTLLDQETWQQSVGRLALAGDQAVRWSWLAILKDDAWRLWGLTIRVGALTTPTRSMLSKGAYLHSESLSVTEAQDRLRSLSTGPGSTEVGNLSYELHAANYPAWWIPPGEAYALGQASQWPEYRIEWPIKGTDELRSMPVWYGQFRVPGIQYSNLYEAIFIHLHGVRPTQRLQSSNIMGNILIRLPYSYRIGEVEVADGHVTADVEWSGFAPRSGLNVHLSARRSIDQVEPDAMEIPVSELGGSITFSLGYNPVQVELFLNDPDIGVPCHQLQWERNQPAPEIAPLMLEPEERTILQQAPLVTSSEETDLFRRLTADEAVQSMLQDRWLEASKCLEADANLAAMVMIGSVMEGALLAIAHQRVSDVMQAANAPKDRSGKTRPLSEWKLDRLVQVSRELNWIPMIMAHFMDVVKTLRNLVHPWEELRRNETPDRAVARLCYQTVESLLEQLSNVNAVGSVQ